MDIISSCYTNNIELEDWHVNLDKIKREFTVMSQKISEIMSLSVKNLITMKQEFENQYDSLFDVSK